MNEIFNRNVIFQRRGNVHYDFSLYNKINAEVCEELEDYCIVFHGNNVVANPHYIGNNFVMQDQRNIENIKCGPKNDVIIAINALHNVNFLPEYLCAIKENLNTGGFFCGNFFGSNNLLHLKNIISENDALFSKKVYPRFNPTISGESVCNVLQVANFTNIVISISKIIFKFSSFKEAMQFLRNINERSYITIGQKYCPDRRIFQHNLTNEIELDFEIIKFYACKI